MCGICGYYQLCQISSPILLTDMNATMVHRGPDDSGIWISSDKRIGLANRRLSIIDLSQAGHQPMCNEDGTIWIVYNGEVYNFTELRNNLQKKGHTFRSRTDSEVLLHLYEDKGEQLVHQLRGMFAFAIWDTHKKQLLLARDRLGIKPLYYALVDGKLIFASEIKAIFASGHIKPSLKREALLQYLALGYLGCEDTLFSGIHKLMPGHILTANEKGITIHQYWDIYQDYHPIELKTEREYTDLILSYLGEAVQMRLVADVPVGIFLSGGIDSSFVAALAARHSKLPVKTFTLGFRDHPEYNELVYARRVANYLNTEAHEILIGVEDVKNAFVNLQDILEEPIINPIWFAIYYVAKLAREHGVIVVLSGDGGDELYAGYNRWMDYLRIYHYGWNRIHKMHPIIKRIADITTKSLIQNPAKQEILRRGFNGEELFWGGTLFKLSQLKNMLAADLYPTGSLWDHLPISRWKGLFDNAVGSIPHDYLEWMSYVSLKGNLLEDYLTRLDKMCMSVSIEGRVPFLDHEFLKQSLSIPALMKYPHFKNKNLLREALRQLLPGDIIDRPKMGFCAPIEYWLNKTFSDQIMNSLENLQHCEKVFNPLWLNATMKSIQRGDHQNAHNWQLLALGNWYSHWIK